MNILEIIWIILTVVGIVYVFKTDEEDTAFSLAMLKCAVLSLIFLIPYIIIKYFDLITTPLW